MRLLDNYIPIVLAAGFGMRLRPLTTLVPKAAVPVGEWPVAYHSIRLFLEMGFTQVHCNVHYLHEAFIDEIQACLKDDNKPLNSVRFWFESEILETGGGIVNIAQQLANEDIEQIRGKDLIVVAGDVLCTPPLEDMLQHWENKKNVATIALMATKKLYTKRPDVIWVSPESNTVLGFGTDYAHGNDQAEARLFTTHQILRSDYVMQCSLCKMSSRDLFYRAGIKKGLSILNYAYSDQIAWHDIGDYAALANTAPTHSLSSEQALAQCLIITCIENNKKNTTDNNSIIDNSSNNINFNKQSSNNIHNIKLSVSLAEFDEIKVVGQFHCLSHFVTSPQDDNLLCALANHHRIRCSPQTPFPTHSQSFVSRENHPILIFRLPKPESFGTQSSHPLLVPLELLSQPLSTLETVSCLPIYQQSQTFFLFVE